MMTADQARQGLTEESVTPASATPGMTGDVPYPRARYAYMCRVLHDGELAHVAELLLQLEYKILCEEGVSILRFFGLGYLWMCQDSIKHPGYQFVLESSTSASSLLLLPCMQAGNPVNYSILLLLPCMLH